MKILITGAAGQLGSALRSVMAQRSDVIFTDHSTLDITAAQDLHNFIADNDITHIVNCAAYTHINRAEVEKKECTRANSDGVKQLALAADSHGVKVLHISSDMVFDGNTHRAYTEADKVNPISHYGASKRAGETALLALAPDSIILRTSWLYSPLSSNNLPARVLDAARTQTSIQVVDNFISSPTNAFDLAHAIERILAAPQWFPGVYHFSNSGICSLYDFAKATLYLAGIRGVQVTPIASERNYAAAPGAARPPFSALDSYKFQLTYGMVPPHWFDSLAACINQFPK